MPFEPGRCGGGPGSRNSSRGCASGRGSAVIADVVSAGAAERGTRTLRAELALKSLGGDLGSPTGGCTPSSNRCSCSQVRPSPPCTFRTGEGDAMSLARSASVPRSLYGLRDSYPATGTDPIAEARGSGRPRWLVSGDLQQDADVRRGTRRGLLAGRAAAATRGGCLVAVGDGPDAFDAEDRRCLDLLAERSPAPPRPRPTRAPRQRSTSPWTPGASRSRRATGAVRHRPERVRRPGRDPARR